jgi:hypothetical protein
MPKSIEAFSSSLIEHKIYVLSEMRERIDDFRCFLESLLKKVIENRILKRISQFNILKIL